MVSMKIYMLLVYPKIFVYLMENPRIKWMMTGGTPISGNFHIDFLNHRGTPKSKIRSF